METFVNPELSIVITAHSEGLLLRPTLNSVAAAASKVVQKNKECQVVIVLDYPDESTKKQAYLFKKEYKNKIQVDIIEVRLKDPGLSRNAGIKRSKGRFIALCDGDDLVSPSYFIKGVELLAKSKKPLILHAEYVLSFGNYSALTPIRATGPKSVDYQDLIYSNLWPSSSISQAETYKTHPYAHYAASNGYGPEDWVWNLETSAAGFGRAIIPNTIYFYRTKKSAGVNNTHQASILPKINISQLKKHLPEIEDKMMFHTKHQTHSLMKWFISVLGLLPFGLGRRLSQLGSKFYRTILRKLVKTIGKAILSPITIFSDQASINIHSKCANIYRTFFQIELTKHPLNPELISELVFAASIEPAISIAASQWENLQIWEPIDVRYTKILEFMLDALSGNQEVIIWVPWLGIGGADMVALNYLKALKECPEFKGEVSIVATYKPERTLQELIPPGTNFIQLPIAFRELSELDQKRLISQIFIQTRPALSLSVNCFDVTNSLSMFSKQMTEETEIYLSLFAFDNISHGFPVNPITDDAERIFLKDISGIITDNSVTQKRLENMLGIPPEQLKIHKQPVFDLTPELRTDSAAFTTSEFTQNNPFKLLWPHRLDKEKRPRSLIEITERAASLQIPIEITVYGQQVLNSDGDQLIHDLLAAGIKYMGPYKGGLSSLPYDEFHAMLLTSESEGMPLVVVQSMLLGLPVIATEVGGIPDLVVQGKTGYLAKSPEDIQGFLFAVQKLANRATRIEIIKKAYKKAQALHSWETFKNKHISEIVSAPASNFIAKGARANSAGR